MINSIRQTWVAMALCLAALAAHADGAAPKPFVAGSMKQIVAARQGKPFILGLWSLACAHCREDISILSRFMKKHPEVEVVLVSTDTPQENEEIVSTLRRHSLERAENWVFADPFTERLRFEIDRKWHGELPRSYLFGADRNVVAISGKLDPRRLERWVRVSITRNQ